jgi:hypothetical protein
MSAVGSVQFAITHHVGRYFAARGELRKCEVAVIDGTAIVCVVDAASNTVVTVDPRDVLIEAAA